MMQSTFPGGVMANDLGFPDIGLTTLQDVSTRSI